MTRIRPWFLILACLLASCSDRESDDPADVGSGRIGVDAGIDAGGDEADDPLAVAEQAARADDFPRPLGFTSVPSAMGHFAPDRQASTFRAGPLGPEVDVQVIDFEQALGKNVGTSPWHIVSRRRYPEMTATTVWGVSLTDLYRIRLDGDRFETIERLPINLIASSITWNLLGADDGSVIVPDPNGFVAVDDGPCRSVDPTFLRFEDDNRLEPGARCTAALTLSPQALRAACDVQGGVLGRGSTGTSLVPTFDGALATTAIFNDGGEQRVYLVVFAADLAGILGCGLLDDSLPTNELAAEAEGGRTVFYAATGDAVVKAAWDPEGRSVQRVWERSLPIRGRTGTTPTLVNAGTERFVVLIDAPCAVASLLNGLIVCDEDPRPARLVAVRRDDDDALDGRPAVITTDLPGWLLTVENSPAARRDMVVVANYSGYLPNGLRVPPGGFVPDDGPAAWLTSPDAIEEHATGVVALRYDARAGAFVVLWSDPDTQVSGVPTISGGANRVYGSGAERSSGRTYLYGFRLLDDDEGSAGERVLRVDIGAAPFRETRMDTNGDVVFPNAEYDYALGEAYDGGNNIVIADDRSALIAGGRSLIRVRDSSR